MLRLFVGIAVPPEQKLALSAICQGLAGLNWVDPGNYHVTLRFIGEVDEAMAADIDAELARLRLPGFPTVIAGTGFFGPPERPRLIYAGVERSDPLLRLHDRVEHALTRAEIPPQGGRFAPHVTLGKPRPGGVAAALAFAAGHNLLRLPAFQVDRFMLIRSYLTKSGSIYEDVAEYPLRVPGDRSGSPG